MRRQLLFFATHLGAAYGLKSTCAWLTGKCQVAVVWMGHSRVGAGVRPKENAYGVKRLGKIGARGYALFRAPKLHKRSIGRTRYRRVK